MTGATIIDATAAKPQHDRTQAERFLRTLDPSASKFTFLLLPEGGRKGRPVELHASLDDAWPTILRLNQPGGGYGVFVTVNEAKDGNRKNIVRARALYTDADTPEQVRSVLAGVEEAGVEPSMAVRSSAKKLHAYWLIEHSPELEWAARLQKALVERLGADGAAKDLARVLRLPGTLHLKGAPQRVELLPKDSPRRYKLAEIVEAFGLGVGRLGTAGALGLGSGIALPTNGPQQASVSHGRAIAAASVGNVLPFPLHVLSAEAQAGVVAANEELTARPEPPQSWFESLPDDDRDGALKQMLDCCADIAGGAREPWLKVLMAASRSGAPSAEMLARAWSERAPDKFNEADFASDWESFGDRERGVSIRTLIALASARGFDASPWKTKAEAARGALIEPKVAAGELGRLLIAPGVYGPEEALAHMNARYAVLTFDDSGEVAIVKHGSGGPVVMRDKDARLELSNVKVLAGDPPKVRPIFDWWLGQAGRGNTRRAIFDPRRSSGIDSGPDKFNFWQGFGVQPISGTDKIARLLDHIEHVICRSDPVKYEYIIRWIAWIVQHPGTNPGVCIVLKSNREGTGKSTLGETIQRIFGCHGIMVSDPEQLLGSFNDHLEHACFVLLEEAMFAGDPRIADRIKARLTAETALIQPKFRSRRSVPNRLAAMLCTNHEWAVDAGNGARRWFVVDVSEARAADAAYFNALYADLHDGGYGQFLNYLLNYDLGDWHPRNPPQTNELKQQKLMSLPSVFEWLWQSADAGQVLGGRQDVALPALGADAPTATLYGAYTGWARDRGLRPESLIAFGKMLTRVLGPSKRLTGARDGHRSTGYAFPDATELMVKVARARGIPIGQPTPSMDARE